MTALKATHVFTPGAYPDYTYVERPEQQLERSLKDALDTPGQLVSLAGPSKSGKTVLVERVVGKDNLIPISGVGIQEPNDIWNKVLNWMEAPFSVTDETGGARRIEAGVEASGKAGVLGLVSGGVAATGTLASETKSGVAITRARTGLSQVRKEIADSSYVVLVDDFHYMPREVQTEAAKALKEAVRLGIKLCTAAVLHRGDDIVRANPELRGRVRAVDLKYWTIEDLISIGLRGFDILNCFCERNDLEQLAKEAAGSPQLMQQICLQACFVLGVRQRLDHKTKLNFSAGDFKAIFEQTSSSTDFRSLVDVLDAGPRTRGTERKIYNFRDGTSGDVYRCVLKAVASDPPMLSFPYDELTRRTHQICVGESPVGSSVTGTCLHMAKLAEDKFPKERVIDWDDQKQVLDIPDPYLAFFLRWSGRLMEVEST
jgi:hypothetical protein